MESELVYTLTTLTLTTCHIVALVESELSLYCDHVDSHYLSHSCTGGE